MKALLAAMSSRPDDCWPWPGYVAPDGYARTAPPGTSRKTTAHRVAYELLVGPVPDGAQLDHLCRNKRCVNPWHLEPVSPGENVRRSPGRGSAKTPRTHCKRGHPLSGANLRIYWNSHGRARFCVACDQLRKHR